MIVAFEPYNFCDFLLVNMIISFHEPWMFHFLLVFKLFPIGYGPTPSKKKDIVWEQKIVKGFSLYNIEKENPFEGRLLVYKVANRIEVHF